MKKVFRFWYCSSFVFIWQTLCNHKVTRLKRLSRDLQSNRAISFCFHIYLMLHTCAARFDVTENLEKFFVFGWTKQGLTWSQKNWIFYFMFFYLIWFFKDLVKLILKEKDKNHCHCSVIHCSKTVIRNRSREVKYMVWKVEEGDLSSFEVGGEKSDFRKS